jgi:hypothetical protein
VPQPGSPFGCFCSTPPKSWRWKDGPA